MTDKQRVLFIGSKQLGLQIVQEMYSLSPDTLAGILTIDDSSDTRSVLDDIKSFSAEKDLPLYIASDRHESENIIRSIGPDLCLVVGWYWLISQETLSSVPGGFIGIHNSLLPKYRGGSPLVWAMINGETDVGFSLFTLGEEMDAGDIWAQESVTVEPDDTIADVMGKLEVKSLEAIRKTYLSILEGSAKAKRQDHNKATWCKQRFPEDGVIDWKMSALDVHNFIRAQSTPYPGAFTCADGVQVKIWLTALCEGSDEGLPGQLVRKGEEEIFVICGDNHLLKLKEVELGGEKGDAARILQSKHKRFTEG